MEFKKVISLMVALFVTQSVLPLTIVVKNNVGSNMSVDPVWTGSPRGYAYVPYGQQGDPGQKYSSGLHLLRKLLVSYVDGAYKKCFEYNLEPYNLRGTGSITITVDTDNIRVKGHKDILFKSKTQVDVTVKPSGIGSKC